VRLTCIAPPPRRTAGSASDLELESETVAREEEEEGEEEEEEEEEEGEASSMEMCACRAMQLLPAGVAAAGGEAAAVKIKPLAPPARAHT
jgi:hypothetical protein